LNPAGEAVAERPPPSSRVTGLMSSARTFSALAITSNAWAASFSSGGRAAEPRKSFSRCSSATFRPNSFGVEQPGGDPPIRALRLFWMLNKVSSARWAFRSLRPVQAWSSTSSRFSRWSRNG